MRRRQRMDHKDPALIMLTAGQRVTQWFTRLEQQNHISAADVMAYLTIREPKIKERLDSLWETIDSDVHGRFLEGLLDEADLQEWRRNLREWLALLHAALALVKLHHSSPMESDLTLPEESALSPEQAAATPEAA